MSEELNDDLLNGDDSSAETQPYSEPTLNLTVDAKDERYPIPVHIGKKHVFTLHFNPGDPFVMKYASDIETIPAPSGKNSRDFVEFGEALERSLDSIFGEGAARQIFRYNGADNALLFAILGKLKEGYTDFHERAKVATNAAKARAVIEAKKEAQAYSAPS